MKKFITTLLVLTGFAASAQAVIVGADAGYLLDSKEEYITARVGFEVAQSNAFSHQLELELGRTDMEIANDKVEIIPLMANYRFVAPVSETGWSYHVGAGLGLARVEIPLAVLAIYPAPPSSASDESLAFQVLAGVSYQLNPTASLTAGLRYIHISDVKFINTDIDIGDDIALTLGLNFKF